MNPRRCSSHLCPLQKANCCTEIQLIWEMACRTDERTKLRAVPTLVKWGTAKKLDDNCHKKDFVEMLLEDD